MKALQRLVQENYYWRIIKRHQTIGASALFLVSALGIIFTTLREPVYEAQAKLKFQSGNFNGYLTDNNSHNQFIGNWDGLVDPGSFINTEAEVIKSYSLIQKTINSLNQKNETFPYLDVETFSNNLKLKRIGNTNILELKYQDTEPIRAAEAANELIVNYLKNYLALTQQEYNTTKNIIEEQLPLFEQKLQQTEAAIRKIQEETKVLVPQEEAMIVATNRVILQQKITELQGQIASINAKSAYIRSQLGMDAQQAIALTMVAQSPDIQESVRQLQRLESQLTQEISRVAGDNPLIQSLKDQITEHKQLIQQKIQNIAGSQGVSLNQTRDFGNIKQNLTLELIQLEATNLGLQEEITYLVGLEKSQQDKASNLPQALERLQQLQRQLALFQVDYESLIQQIRNYEISNNPVLTNNIQVISYATVPTKPIRSDYLDYLGSIGLGFLAATLIIVLAEVMDTSVTTIEATKKLFGYPWLGIIPDIQRSQFISDRSGASSEKFPSVDLKKLPTDTSIPKVIVRDFPGVSASESYRMLQSNIKFLSTYKEVKVIVVTSSVSQEGKSTVAANLACAMAQARHRVLLIDGNFHYPIQHQIWHKSCPHGLSDILREKADTKQIVQEIFPKLHLIASGIIASSPATLLDSTRMKNVMDEWRKSYDFVIVDTPALDLAADAPILGRIADGVLLVVKPTSVNQSKANFAKEILLRSGQNVLGIVFNQIDPQVEPKNYFYQALESRPEEKSESKTMDQSREELWLTVSQMSQESKKPKVILTPEEIIALPTEQLQEIVNYLQQDLEDLTQLVKEQEEELFMQSQMVKKLQKRVNLSRDIDRPFLVQQLTQEQERKNMLNETLVGQRRNLERKQQMLRQYHQALTMKQTQ